MTEVLNISVTADARDLFVEHDISTIKKIKATALNEISHKQNVLRQFIGDNYRPLLDTPPVLKEIQTIFDSTQNTLKQMNSFSHSITSSTVSFQQPQPATPFSIVSQLYLDSLNTLSNNEFSNSLQCALKAAKEFEKPSGSQSLYAALKFSVDSLPCRIFAAMQVFLTSPTTVSDSNINSNTLYDCFSASTSLLYQYPQLKTRASPTASSFIYNSLIKRIDNLVSTATQIPDVCLLFMSLIEAVIFFLNTTKAPTLILDHLLKAFKSSFEKNISQFSNLDLREILRVSKMIEDSTRNRFSTPQIVSAMKELKLKIDFMSTFIEVFKLLSAQSIRVSVENLNLKDEIIKILNDVSIEEFDAGNFSLNSTSSLSLRALGVSPIITDFQKRLDSPILLIVSQLQSQVTQIATSEMLKIPLKVAVNDASQILKDAINKTPLTVCLIINALCSLSAAAQLGDSVSDLLSLQNESAKEWAKRVAHESCLILQRSIGVSSKDKQPLTNDNIDGCAFRFLSFLERSILKAAGHIQHHPLDTNLRYEARRVVVDFFSDELKKMEFSNSASDPIEARKRIEDRAAKLFEEYSLIAQVLAINRNSEIRTLFIQKMNPVDFNSIDTQTTKKVDQTLSQSGEMFKLIGGGLQAREHNSVDIDVNLVLDRLFPNS
ncbi:hypothetical protein M9Y10_021527 [Tritrichomonas musculus]|uniref:Conserved oligomeric Golgi complex subunit 1 n=1 Tax=Tritrichomonas musculus TaxID=1915356 RepID=A0ABR2KQB0_9EUKA